MNICRFSQKLYFSFARMIISKIQKYFGIFLLIVNRYIGLLRISVEMMIAGPLGQLRDPHQIVAHKSSGIIHLGPKVVLFLHWDRSGQVRESLFEYIRQLKDSGRSVVFVTNSGWLEPSAEAMLITLCSSILIRRNVGYDFGGWRDAIEMLDLPRPDTEEIIIANDSVCGPFLPLEPMLLRLDYTVADVWGLTDSWQHRYHLQSYFVAFGPRAIRSPVFRRFWSTVIPAPSKLFIVRRYEIGLTQALLEDGLEVSALWPYETLTRQVTRAQIMGYLESDRDETIDARQLARWRHALRLREAIANRVALNPTSDLWRQLLLSDYPFIKRELIYRNPNRVEDIDDWKNISRISILKASILLNLPPKMVENSKKC